MLDLSRLFRRLDRLGLPGCCKDLAKAIAQATERGSTLRMSEESFQTGTDSRPLVEHGFIHWVPDSKKRDPKKGAVRFTEKAERLIS